MCFDVFYIVSGTNLAQIAHSDAILFGGIEIPEQADLHSACQYTEKHLLSKSPFGVSS
jgi:hypothetical protein